jgi:serine phosphatase RsbU (regulator of sigma subunit)
VPLTAGGRRPGALGLRFAERRTFTEDDLAFLSTIGQLSAAALARARRYASEHEVAEVLQRSLLPSTAPEAPGLDLAVRYVPGAEDMTAGGDWYATLPLASGRVALAVGDVVGHGMHAAAAMGRLRGALLAYAIEHEDPARVLGLLSRLAARAPGTELSTAVVALVDPAAREIRYACAGHPPPLVTGPAGARYLEGGRGRPLGFCDDGVPVGVEVLAPGERLVLYSDGLFERRGEDVGAGLARLLAAAPGDDPDAEALAARLLAWATGGGGVRDDVALLVAAPVPPAG